MLVTSHPVNLVEIGTRLRRTEEEEEELVGDTHTHTFLLHSTHALLTRIHLHWPVKMCVIFPAQKRCLPFGRQNEPTEKERQQLLLQLSIVKKKMVAGINGVLL